MGRALFRVGKSRVFCAICRIIKLSRQIALWQIATHPYKLVTKLMFSFVGRARHRRSRVRIASAAVQFLRQLARDGTLR